MATEFQKRVWEEIDKIPYGKTVTYKEIAKKIGKPNASRAVANACGNLGLVYVGRGAHEQAEAMQQRALAIELELGRKEGIASTLGNLALIARCRNDLPKCRELLLKALDLFTEIGARDRIEQTRALLDSLPPDDS